LKHKNSLVTSERKRGLTAEAIQGPALALKGVDDVHGSDGLALGVLSVGDGIANDVLQEDLQDTAGLLIDEAGDALDTTSASKATNGGFGDALDVVTEHLAVPLSATLAKTLASFSASSHVELIREIAETSELLKREKRN
jgi:hypothetical protein